LSYRNGYHWLSGWLIREASHYHCQLDDETIDVISMIFDNLMDEGSLSDIDRVFSLKKSTQQERY